MSTFDDADRDRAERELKERLERTRRTIVLSAWLIAVLAGSGLYFSIVGAQMKQWHLSLPALTFAVTVGPLILLAHLIGMALVGVRLRRVVRKWAEEIAARHKVPLEAIVYLVDYWEKGA